MRWLVVCCTLALTACSITPTEPIDQERAQAAWLSRQTALKQITHWRLDGRIAISQGEDFYAVNLRWRQKHADFNIDISGPMGSGHFKLKGVQHGDVYLRDSDQNNYHAQNPETLVYQHTGMHIPVNGLFYWVRGLPDPSLPQQQVAELDQQGHLQKLVQDGWTVEFSDYADFVEHQLPEKLVIQHDDIEIKLIVHRWQLRS